MPTRKKKNVTKKDFVLSLPMDLPNAEVIARGKSAGLALNAHQVATIRWTEKTRRSQEQLLARLPQPQTHAPRLRTRPTRTTTTTVTKKTNGHIEREDTPGFKQQAALIRNATMHIGVDGVRAIIDAIEKEFTKLSQDDQAS